MDPRRLADPALAVPVRPDTPRHQAQFVPAHLPLEDPRQPAPEPRGADAPRAAGRGMDDAPWCALVLDHDRAGRDGVAAAAARRTDARRSGEGAIVPRVLAEPAVGHRDRARAGRPRCDVSRVPRLGHRTRHRLDPGAADDYETTA